MLVTQCHAGMSYHNVAWYRDFYIISLRSLWLHINDQLDEIVDDSDWRFCLFFSFSSLIFNCW